MDVGLARQHPRQRAGQQLVVVDEQHADRFRVARTDRQAPSLAARTPYRHAARSYHPAYPPTDRGRDNPSMRVALLGFGLIGGSIARALRAVTRAGRAGRADRGLVARPAGGPRAARRGRRRRCRRLAVAARRSTAPTSSSWPRRRWPASTSSDASVSCAIALAPGVLVHRRREHEDADRRGRGARSACRSSAATRWPVREAHRLRRASSADLFRDRPWIVVPGATSPADGAERVEALARATGARPIRARRGDPRPGRRRDQPRAARRRDRARGGGRRDLPTDRTVADWAVESGLAASGWASMTRLALGSPEMGAGIAATNAPRSPTGLRDVRAVLDVWIAALEAEAVDAARADRPVPRRAGSAGDGRPGRRRMSEAEPERVLVVPRAAVVAEPWRGLRTDPDGLAEAIAAIDRHGRFEPRPAMEVDPGLQAGDPVPRPARRRALVPHASHARPARTPASTSAGRSAWAVISTRATATWPAGSSASGARSSTPSSCPAFRPVGLLNDDETDVGRGPPRGRVRGRRRRPGGRRARARQARRARSRTRPTSAAVRDRLESWSELVFDALRVRTPVPDRVRAPGRAGVCAYNRQRRAHRCDHSDRDHRMMGS